MEKKFLLFILFVLIGINACNIPVIAVEMNHDKELGYSQNIKLKDPMLVKLVRAKTIVDDNQYSQKIKNDNFIYAKVKKQQDYEFYQLYTILDKIIRANELDYQIWRIGLVNEPLDMNAFSTCVNAITINSGLYDSMFNNEDALAFIISHELSHLLYNHHQKAAEFNSAMSEWIKYMEKHPEDSDIYELKLNVYRKKIAKVYRQQEKDADIEGIKLMTQAGFNPKGAIDAMNFISQNPQVYKDTSDHPEIKERIHYISEEVNNIDVKNLNTIGKANIYESVPLISKTSSDRKYLLLLNDVKNRKAKYVPETYEDKLIKNGYVAYKNKKINIAKKYFLDAYEINKKNTVTLLYLSYIDEYGYKLSHNKKMLKDAKKWILKAIKIDPYDSNIVKQKLDLDNYI